jgi:hypothetical protein
VKKEAIREAGERVVAGLAGQRSLRPLAFGDLTLGCLVRCFRRGTGGLFLYELLPHLRATPPLRNVSENKDDATQAILTTQHAEAVGHGESAAIASTEQRVVFHIGLTRAHQSFEECMAYTQALEHILALKRASVPTQVTLGGCIQQKESACFVQGAEAV